MTGWKFRCTLHKFPSEIVVHVEGPFDSEYNTCRYVPERTTTGVCVSSGVTGHCECEACGKSIDPWDGYCRHCGARITEVGW